MSMFNCAAVIKWKQSVAWLPSCGAKSFADMERNFLRMFLWCYDKCLCILSCYAKSTCVVVKKQLESRHRQLGKTVVVKAGAYLCL